MALTWSQTIDSLFTSTWMNRRTTAIEQAYLKTPFIFWLKQKGKVEEMRGYTRIEIPLEYGKNETVTWIQKGSTVPLTETELLTMCYENWKYSAATILRYGVEDQQNRGAARVIDYLTRKTNAAERAMWLDLERVVFSDGTGVNEPNGLKNIIPDGTTVATTNTLHGLSRSTYDWFKAQQKTATGAFSVYGISDMRNMLNNITKYANSEVKDIFYVTDQTTYEAFEDLMLQMKQVFNQELIDAGFENLVYRGRPLMWSPSAPSGNMYFVNPNYLKLMVDPDYQMEMTEWKPIPDQVNDRVCQITSAMNFICSRPVSQGVLVISTY